MPHSVPAHMFLANYPTQISGQERPLLAHSYVVLFVTCSVVHAGIWQVRSQADLDMWGTCQL